MECPLVLRGCCHSDARSFGGGANKAMSVCLDNCTIACDVPTVAGFAIVAKLAKMGVDRTPGVDKGWSAKRVIRTMAVATAPLVVPK